MASGARVGCAIGSGHRRVGADDSLGGRRFAMELAALVLGERRLQGGHQVGGNPSQALLVAADGRHLGDHRADPPVGGSQHDRMAAGVAGAPHPDPVGVDRGVALQERDRSAPVGDLHPGVDVEARRSAAGPEPAVVVHQDHESRLGEHPGEAVQSVLLYPGEPVRHRDGRVRCGAFWDVQPAPQRHAALRGEFNVLALHHHPPFPRTRSVARCRSPR